jgi:seryl-tRNA synthetase
MREYVCIGAPAMVLDFRKRWITRGGDLAKQLGLDFTIANASDPFFGRAGRLAAMSQLEQALKFELLVPVRSEEEPTACMSFNYHLDHFTGAWQLSSENGTTVHTGCVAFGLDRLALALFAKHGVDPREWPTEVRRNFPFDEM